MGDVDETNCAIGLAILAVRHSSDAADLAIEPVLTRIQNDLFDLGADLCLPRQAHEAPGAALRIAASQVKALERAIDTLNARLDPLRSFVLPGGTAAAAALHQARAVCRRAERAMVALAAIEGEEVGEAALAYVNRLSDYLFVAARAANDFGKSDVLWAPGANQSESAEQTEDDEPISGDLQAAIGVISGTSMDGIDVALIESDGEAQLKTGPAATFPYPPAVAERLRAVVADLSEAQAPQLELERLVTDAHVAAVEAFLERFSIARERVALVGLHGQTILHRPRAGLTRQLCDGARAAAALGDRRGLGLSFGRRRGRRRRRAARADLSCGDGRGP